MDSALREMAIKILAFANPSSRGQRRCTGFIVARMSSCESQTVRDIADKRSCAREAEGSDSSLLLASFVK